MGWLGAGGLGGLAVGGNRGTLVIGVEIHKSGDVLKYSCMN